MSKIVVDLKTIDGKDIGEKLVIVKGGATYTLPFGNRETIIKDSYQLISPMYGNKKVAFASDANAILVRHAGKTLAEVNA
jgi:hypothetical protein